MSSCRDSKGRDPPRLETPGLQGRLAILCVHRKSLRPYGVKGTSSGRGGGLSKRSAKILELWRAIPGGSFATARSPSIPWCPPALLEWKWNGSASRAPSDDDPPSTWKSSQRGGSMRMLRIPSGGSRGNTGEQVGQLGLDSRN
eukprot:GHVS01098778.1.p2 GENE.GHVS01098778.1~~GHVS01098778.1.p2  ORF type:complete len:143 (+),score=3.50 GHVS01098778.1:76-504(+)